VPKKNQILKTTSQGVWKLEFALFEQIFTQNAGIVKHKTVEKGFQVVTWPV